MGAIHALSIQSRLLSVGFCGSENKFRTMSFFHVSFLLLPEKSITADGLLLREVMQRPVAAYHSFEAPISCG